MSGDGSQVSAIFFPNKLYFFRPVLVSKQSWAGNTESFHVAPVQTQAQPLQSGTFVTSLMILHWHIIVLESPQVMCMCSRVENQWFSKGIESEPIVPWFAPVQLHLAFIAQVHATWSGIWMSSEWPYHSVRYFSHQDMRMKSTWQRMSRTIILLWKHPPYAELCLFWIWMDSERVQAFYFNQ